MKNYSRIFNIHTLIAFVGLLGLIYMINTLFLQNTPYMYLYDILYVLFLLNGTVWDALKIWHEKKRSAWQEKKFRYNCYTLLLSTSFAWLLTFIILKFR